VDADLDVVVGDAGSGSAATKTFVQWAGERIRASSSSASAAAEAR
jgi:hypothetical protein